MNKKNLAKLALMGLLVTASGGAHASEGPSASLSQGTLLAGGCGGKSGCGSIAMENYPNQRANQYNAPQGSCGRARPINNGNEQQRNYGAPKYDVRDFPVYSSPSAPTAYVDTPPVHNPNTPVNRYERPVPNGSNPGVQWIDNDAPLY